MYLVIKISKSEFQRITTGLPNDQLYDWLVSHNIACYYYQDDLMYFNSKEDLALFLLKNPGTVTRVE